MTIYKQLSSILKPLKYSTSHEDFLRLIRENPEDEHTRRVYADYLQEHDYPHDENDLHLLRNLTGPGWVHRDKEGRIRSGPAITEHQVEQNLIDRGFENTTVHGGVHNGPGGSFYVRQVRLGRDQDPYYGYSTHNVTNVRYVHPRVSGFYHDPALLHQIAEELANTIQ